MCKWHHYKADLTESNNWADSGNLSLRGGPFVMPDHTNVAFDEPPFFFETVISNEPRRESPWSLITISKRFFGNCAQISL